MSDLQSNTTILKFYWRHAMRYPHLLWGMILTLPLALLTNLFLPALLTAEVMNRLSTGDFTDGDLWGSFGTDIAAIVGFGILGGVIIWRINIYCNWKLEGLIVRDLNQRVFDHMLRLSSGFHSNHFGGALVSQTSKLASAYVRITDTTMFQAWSLLWALVFTSVILWSRAPEFVLVLNICSLLYLLIAVFITKKVRYLNKIEADASNQQTGQLADSITNVMAIKSFSAAYSEKRRFHGISEKTRQATVNLMFATLKIETMFSMLGALLGAASLILAIASIVLWNANIATVFLVFTYTNSIRDYLWQFSTHALRNYNRAFGDAQAMVEILGISPGVKDPEHPEKSRIHEGKIMFKNMSFTHGDSSDGDSLFVNLNETIKPSEKIGLVGRSGSGKTSLTKLLLRFNDIDGGEILIDGQNIAHLTQDDLRASIAYVPQEPLLFHRTIRENIGYGQEGATDEEVYEAAKKANAHEFIEKLSEGYDTLVGERGVKLSGGQRQRIAIARAILKDAPILVLDEATSALDSESEKLIQDALRKLMKGRTAIVIAHRLSTIQHMDRILVLEDGVIIEQGSHAELVKNKTGTYAQLWAHQSGGFIEE